MNTLALLLSTQLAFYSNHFYNRIMSEPFKLYRLQQVDLQIDSASKRIEEIEATLSDNKAVLNAKAELEAIAETVKQSEKKLKRAEQDVGDQQLKIEQNQNKLYSGKVTNPKELQDLQLEKEALNRHLDTLEDSQLERMVTNEEVENKRSESQEFLESLEAKGEFQAVILKKDRKELFSEVERLEGERQTGIGGIPAEDIKLYEKLRKTKAGVAVSKVSDKACSACGSMLPAALAQEARSPNKISRCNTCGRILYSG